MLLLVLWHPHPIPHRQLESPLPRCYGEDTLPRRRSSVGLGLSNLQEITNHKLQYLHFTK